MMMSVFHRIGFCSSYTQPQPQPQQYDRSVDNGLVADADTDATDMVTDPDLDVILVCLGCINQYMQ